MRFEHSIVKRHAAEWVDHAWTRCSNEFESARAEDNPQILHRF
jgi:hypothetical protein